MAGRLQGRVALVTGAGSSGPGVSGPAYSATKAGLLGLTVDLAGAQGLDNVRVNAVVPGMILGPMADTLRRYRDQARRSRRGRDCRPCRPIGPCRFQG